jgi:hypothetical protein
MNHPILYFAGALALLSACTGNADPDGPAMEPPTDEVVAAAPSWAMSVCAPVRAAHADALVQELAAGYALADLAEPTGQIETVRSTVPGGSLLTPMVAFRTRKLTSIADVTGALPELVWVPRNTEAIFVADDGTQYRATGEAPAPETDGFSLAHRADGRWVASATYARAPSDRQAIALGGEVLGVAVLRTRALAAQPSKGSRP